MERPSEDPNERMIREQRETNERDRTAQRRKPSHAQRRRRFDLRVPRWLMDDGLLPTLTAGQLRVFIAICAYANSRTRNAWPKYATLAEGTGLASDTIGRAICRLERLGCLKRWRHGNKWYFHLHAERQQAVAPTSPHVG